MIQFREEVLHILVYVEINSLYFSASNKIMMLLVV